MPRRFRFRLVPALATLCAVMLGIALGNWQTRRANEKQAIEARMTERQAHGPEKMANLSGDPTEDEFRRIVVDGEFVADWQVYLDNRPHQSMPGFYVLTPLKIAGSDSHILVARGWIQRDLRQRSKIDAPPPPSGTVRIEGVVRRGLPRTLELGEAGKLRPAAIAQNLSIDEFASASGLKMQPYLLEQTSDTGDRLVRDWPRPSSGADKHRGYAFQWYALAATAFLFFVVTGFRRERRS